MNLQKFYKTGLSVKSSATMYPSEIQQGESMSVRFQTAHGESEPIGQSWEIS
ncbi:hypothetical protein L873DRAFT_1817237 [Choiromyces venosus 120613-1]|uniref:Uncharacterized protein n=1 Tax=Choiromyces venosus 120613-1 TaxID=1336337 RepID=A0A3N4J6M8_9PEZI|nr:hypothetical protein L873DRAFT_1817237 [Choiromyces venosus 120613-1]